ncbi:MAG: hypothetical protein OEZ10_08765 [Gammaproteobacteria bacterium]|nr:hypothetical protein [Gammaproteobacteria bacterium]
MTSPEKIFVISTENEKLVAICDNADAAWALAACVYEQFELNRLVHDLDALPSREECRRVLRNGYIEVMHRRKRGGAAKTCREYNLTSVGEMVVGIHPHKLYKGAPKNLIASERWW